MKGYSFSIPDPPEPPVLSVNSMTGNVVIAEATTSKAGLLSASDKKYLTSLTPTLRLITSNPKAQITVKKNNITYSGTNNNGTWTFSNLPEYGDYNVSYTLNGTTQTYTKSVNYIGINEYKINYTYVCTNKDFSAGKWRNCSPTLIYNQLDGSEGFTLTGSSSSSGVASCLSWNYTLDFTYVNSIEFYGRKNANHGMIISHITDGLEKSPVVYYASTSRHYNDNTAGTWYYVKIDTSKIVGSHVFSLIGGYTDSTGASASSTSYCNIKINY